jgi:hypothetical protein
MRCSGVSIEFSLVVCAGVADSFDGRAVAAEAIRQESCDATDGGNADACEIVNLPIGQILLQVFHNLPAIDQCLEFGGSAEVLEEIAALSGRPEADYGLEKGILGTLLLSL